MSCRLGLGAVRVRPVSKHGQVRRPASDYSDLTHVQVRLSTQIHRRQLPDRFDWLYMVRYGVMDDESGELSE